jgi:hypothetical protein
MKIPEKQLAKLAKLLGSCENLRDDGGNTWADGFSTGQRELAKEVIEILKLSMQKDEKQS